MARTNHVKAFRGQRNCQFVTEADDLYGGIDAAVDWTRRPPPGRLRSKPRLRSGLCSV